MFPFRPLLPACLALMLIGWGGVAGLVLFSPPTVWARWAFYAFWIMALSGTALPAAHFLNRRFPSDPPAGPGVIIRQANWVGLFGAALAWLSNGRFLTIYSALVLAGGLLLLEWLLRQMELSQRAPRRTQPPGPLRPSLNPAEPDDDPPA